MQLVECNYDIKHLDLLANTYRITFLAKISRVNGFSGMPDRMAWSDLMPEVVFWSFLRMRSKNMAQNPSKIAFLAKIL